MDNKQLRTIRDKERQDYPYKINHITDLYHGQKILVLQYPTSKIKRKAIYATIDQISRRSFKGKYYIRLREGQWYDGFYQNYRCIVWDDGRDYNFKKCKNNFQINAQQLYNHLSTLYWEFRKMYLRIYNWAVSEKLYSLATIDLIEPLESSTDYNVL